VRRGDTLATLHLSRDAADAEGWTARCRAAFNIGDDAPTPRPLIHAVIE